VWRLREGPEVKRDYELVRICRTREEAHQAALECYAQAQALIADGKRVKFGVDEDNDTLSARQRRFLHGPVFGQIAEQAWVTIFDADGKEVKRVRYVQDAWKEFYRRLFLEAEPVYEMVNLPGYKRAVPRRVRKSTEDLDVKEYSEHIDKVLAHAATELHVKFVFDIDERESVRYREPVRKAKASKQRETDAVPA